VDSRSRVARERARVAGMEQTPFRPTIRSQADLERAWGHLIAPLGFTRQSLWLMVIEPDDRSLPQLIEIADLSRVPEADDRPAFVSFLQTIADETPLGGRATFLLSRPGHDRVHDDDRSWAEMLYDACRSAELPCETVHLASDEGIRPLPLDEIRMRRPA